MKKITGLLLKIDDLARDPYRGTVFQRGEVEEIVLSRARFEDSGYNHLCGYGLVNHFNTRDPEYVWEIKGHPYLELAVTTFQEYGALRDFLKGPKNITSIDMLVGARTLSPKQVRGSQVVQESKKKPLIELSYGVYGGSDVSAVDLSGKHPKNPFLKVSSTFLKSSGINLSVDKFIENIKKRKEVASCYWSSSSGAEGMVLSFKEEYFSADHTGKRVFNEVPEIKSGLLLPDFKNRDITDPLEGFKMLLDVYDHLEEKCDET